MAAGAQLAAKHDWSNSDNFPNWADMLQVLTQAHWNATGGAVRETMARPWFNMVGPKCLSSGGAVAANAAEPCELDVAVLLGALYSKAAPGLGEQYPQTMTPYDGRILATATLLVESMGPVYQVNEIDDQDGLPGVLIGRYPGDEYSGVIMSEGAKPVCEGFGCANPWFLTTHALAELIYEVAAAAAKGELETKDELVQKFLVMAIDLGKPAQERGKINDLPESKEELTKLLIKGGDGVLVRAKKHAGPGLHMSEQIYRGNDKMPPLTPGQMVGARDLTWSYASLLDALYARAEVSIDLRHLLA